MSTGLNALNLFRIEPVEVVGLDGTTKLYPNVASREMEASVDYITSSIGANIAADDVAKILSKMSLSASLTADRKTVKVAVPCTRSDILHACDIMEDVAIAYGYNNLVKEIPRTLTYGKQQPLNKLTDLLRQEVAMAGYTEALTLSLVFHLFLLKI
jgi:phenylalanyl-tRNA synthetase beta chain